MSELDDCPCCGGEAEMKPTNIYMSKARAVVCKKCGLRTKLVFINTPEMNIKGKPDESTRYTEEQAEKIASELWNRRCAEQLEKDNTLLRQEVAELKKNNKDLEAKASINKGAMRAYREECENAHDEAVKDFSHFLIDKAEGGSIEVAELPDLVAEWKSPSRKSEKVTNEINEALDKASATLRSGSLTGKGFYETRFERVE